MRAWRAGAPHRAPAARGETSNLPAARLRAMREGRRRPELARADKVLTGVWRLRLPLPWPGVPHGNAFAVEAGGGVVLFDTGIGGEGRLRQLELALAQAGFRIEEVR